MTLPFPDCPEECGTTCSKHVFDPDSQGWKRCARLDPTKFSTINSSIQAKFAEDSFDAYQPTKEDSKAAVVAGKRIAHTFSVGKTPTKSLVFVGDDLSDRTRVACLCLRDCLRLNLDVSYTTLALLTDLYFNNRPDYLSHFRPRVLLVELGFEIPNSSTFAILSEIYFTRANDSKYTFFASKHPLAKFKDIYSQEFHDLFKGPLFMEVKVSK